MTRKPIVAGAVPVPSRRALLGSGSALLACAAAIAGAKGEERPAPALAGLDSHPDAELLRLSATLDAVDAACMAGEPAALAMPDGQADAWLETVMEPCYAAVDRMAEIEARTLDGLMAQARGIDWCRSGEPVEPDAFGQDGYVGPGQIATDRIITAAIVRGLLAMRGAGTVAAPAAPNPDAELIALCDQHIRNLVAFNAPRGVPEDETQDPLWHAYTGTLKAINKADPQTAAGCAAIARAARAEAWNGYSGKHEMQGTMAEPWGMKIIHALVRLEGGAA